MAQNNLINPNSDKDTVDQLDLSDQKNFPLFIKKITIDRLKQINNLSVEFKHPISIIAGVNRSGKTTILNTIACSHENFKKRNITNGILERHTWQDFMKFTINDRQNNDYEYSIEYKIGSNIQTKSGKRNHATKKWSGVAKKEGQIKNREVRYIDLSRLLPARNFGKAILRTNPSNNAVDAKLTMCLSHILETDFTITTQFSHQDKDTFCYQELYSSFNAASGEESLIRLLREIIEAPEKSLILIDEIEASLHPKIQRRLIDILYFFSRYENKQFIITSHSPMILSCLPKQSRIFIEEKNGNYKCEQDKSINFILSKMDSITYPLIDLCCEDTVAMRVINKLLDELIHQDSSYRNLINVMVTGAASTTFNIFNAFKNTYKDRKIKTGYACILDADMKSDKTYQNNEYIHFLLGQYTNENPETFLVKEYLSQNPHNNLQYYVNNANNHVLFKKMHELNIVNSNADDNLEAFNLCWDSFIQNNPNYLNNFKLFIDNLIDKFSNDNL